MNKVKFFIFSLMLTFLPNIVAMDRDTHLLDTFTTHSGQTVIVKPIVNDFDTLEPLFQAVYAGLYTQHPSVMADRIKQFSSINVIAQLAYEQDKKEFDTHESTAYFVQAILDEKPIGYLSFYTQSDGSVYADKLLIDPAYQRMGISKRLVSTIFILRPEATKITLITHRANSTAVNMYKSHGCVEIPIPPDQAWADPTLWIGLEFTKK